MARGVGGHGPANVMKHLKGIDFPVSKQQLLEHARKGPGPDTEDVMDVLEQIPDKEYNTPAEVMQELGNVAYAE